MYADVGESIIAWVGLMPYILNRSSENGQCRFSDDLCVFKLLQSSGDFEPHHLVGAQHQILIQCHGFAADEVFGAGGHGLQGVRADGLRVFAEVAERQQRVVADVADDVFVVGVEGNQTAAVQTRVVLADVYHVAQALIDLPCRG